MQLQLIPFPPHPAILFAFTLPALPPTLPFPPSYAGQLQLLLHTDLDPPPSPYALDKAVWAVHLIEIVTFDLPKRKVHVKMVDDSVIEWEMRGEEPWLKRVQENVEKSTKEAERERNDELNAAANTSIANPYLPLTHPPPCPPEVERESTTNTRSHRRSKSLFNSLLSALSIGSYTHSGAQPYRIGGGGGRRDRFETSAEHLASTIRAFSISSLSTSEFTYPPRAQLRLVSSPASRILRRNARSALVDCFRRWVVPTVRERLRWGAFIPYDEDLGTGIEETKWGKMSKATNAYADWACRSKIRRCESTLRDALALVASPTEESGPRQEGVSDKESRRSSASSTLASAISASSRASSTHEQPSPDCEFDEFPESILAATLKTPRPNALGNLTGPYTSVSTRHVSALRSITTKFKTLHDMLGADARGMAEGHNLALRALEERGRRRGWSSMESGGIGKSRLCSVSNAEYGTGSSIWEISIPVIRSALGEISSTWEDWQMEWEMEREFEHDDVEDFNVSDFPDVVSDFDSGPFRSDIELNGHGRNPSLTATEMDILDVEVECHSEFSDESDEAAALNTNDISPTSPSDFATLQQLSSSDDSLEITSASIIKAHRGRRSGVQARLGTYEDVRDEMPPNPPLVALSPPPARLRTGKENAVGPSAAEVRSNAGPSSANRPPRGIKPLKMQPPPTRINSHRREGASSEQGSGDFAQTRVGDVQSGMFEDWEEETEAGDVFGPVIHPTLEPRRFLGSLRDALESRIVDDGGVSVLEQVGASSEVASSHVYPPGLHGDYPWGAHPPSPTRKVLAVSPRRRDFAELAGDDAREALVMEKPSNTRSPRPKPHLTLSLSAMGKPLPALMTDSHLGQGHGSVTVVQETRPTLSAPAHVSSFGFDSVPQRSRTLETPPKEDAPALLLDTPTVEHHTSTYPYTWDINVVPRGMVVVGRVGVAEESTSSTNDKPSSGAGKAIKGPGKLRKPNPNAKPIVCVTPPPLPPVPPLPSKEEQARLVRSKSWKGLLSRSEKDTLQVTSEGKLIKRRRRSAEPLGSETSSSKKVKDTKDERSSLVSSTSTESLDSIDSDDLGEVIAPTETYHIPDAWFTVSEPKPVMRTSGSSVNLSTPEPEHRPVRTSKSMGTLNRLPSFIEIDPALAPVAPPPPRPTKSLKRSRSVGHSIAES